MHDAMTRLKTPPLSDSVQEQEEELDPAELHASSVDVDDRYITGEKILWVSLKIYDTVLEAKFRNFFLFNCIQSCVKVWGC